MNDDDRANLVEFLRATEADLSFIFDVGRPYIAPVVFEKLNPAWNVVREKGDLEALARAVRDGRHDDRLDSAGLSGLELEFKLAGWSAARVSGRSDRTRRPLKRWLKWIDVILGSLLAVTGIGEGVKELKEGVEAEIDDSEER